MPNRRLNAEELQKANWILDEVRQRLEDYSEGDAALFWAMRRKVSKELAYDERSKPAQRKLLKKRKWKQQGGLCAGCQGPLPVRGSVLDRIEAMGGYTDINTRLLCPSCDVQIQSERGYA